MIGRLADWIVAMAGGHVSPTAHRMGMAFVRFARLDLGGELRPSVASLCKIANVSERHAHRAIKELRAEGWIKVVGMHEESRCNIYALTIPATGESRHHDKTRHHGETRSSEGGGSRSEGGGETSHPNAESENAEVNAEDSTDASAPWFTGDNEPPTDRDERAPDDVIASLQEFATVDALSDAENPPVPPPPLSPAKHPTPVATVSQPALPALPAPAVATDAPAAPRKRPATARKRKPAVEGAEDAARAVTDAWDAAWAVTFRRSYQSCAETCANVGKHKCREHWPGYGWTKGEIMQVRAALKGSWTAPRLVRLMPIYHRELDGKNIPRTVGAFLRGASTIEARHPAPAASAPAPIDRSIPTYIEPFVYEPRPDRPPLVLVPPPKPRPEMSREDAAREIAALRDAGCPAALIRQMEEQYA